MLCTIAMAFDPVSARAIPTKVSPQVNREISLWLWSLAIFEASRTTLWKLPSCIYLRPRLKRKTCSGTWIASQLARNFWSLARHILWWHCGICNSSDGLVDFPLYPLIYWYTARRLRAFMTVRCVWERLVRWDPFEAANKRRSKRRVDQGLW